jgi:hypothetical protein
MLNLYLLVFTTKTVDMIQRLQMSKAEQGVLILALGHRMYVEKAFNLALSIRATSPSMHVTLVHSNNISELSVEQRFIFNKLIECDSAYYTLDDGTKSFIKAKLYLDKITPYKKTIFLDADMVVSPYKTIDTLFEQLNGQEFVMICRGEDRDFSQWVDAEEVCKSYNIEKYYDCSSEFMYFESTDIFEDARIIHDEITDGKIWFRKFANGIPDEPPIIIAMLRKFGKPFQVPFKPSYWQPVEKDLKTPELWNDFYLLSMGGKVNDVRVVKVYNNIVKWYSDKIGVTSFKHTDKQAILAERKTM